MLLVDLRLRMKFSLFVGIDCSVGHAHDAIMADWPSIKEKANAIEEIKSGKRGYAFLRQN